MNNNELFLEYLKWCKTHAFKPSDPKVLKTFVDFVLGNFKNKK